MNMFQIILIIHIFLAIMWVGGVLFVGWGVYPAAGKLPFPVQRHFYYELLRWTHLLFALTGSGVILTGIALGTVLGPLRTWSAIFTTRFGHIWISALVIALLTLAWGIFIGNKHAMSIMMSDSLWDQAAAGNQKPLKYALLKTALIESMEIIGFIALIICMVLF